MPDIFENPILCKKCNIKMKQIETWKNGFLLRAVKCSSCGARIFHPKDEIDYQNFINLKNKTFKVKMRIVGNSYAVSIPKEIVDFIHEQEKIMSDIVKLTFNDSKRLNLIFGED
mgnify:CR=1 FL=1